MIDEVRIADLKRRLGEYLRKVKGGRSLTVLDRNTPIARIVPWHADDEGLKVRPPLPGAPKLQRVPLPTPVAMSVDVVSLLLEERQGDLQSPSPTSLVGSPMRRR